MKAYEIVMIDSDQAAKYVKDYPVSGWLDRHGKLWRDEGAARYNGCTHVRCSDCGQTTEKKHVYCRKCSVVRLKERWRKMPSKEWDEKTPLYSLLLKDFFYKVDDVKDYLAENKARFNDLCFVICERYKPLELTIEYFGFGPHLEAPDRIEDIISAFNDELMKIPDLPWEPGRYRAEYVYD